jgi:hypothetical protein
VTAGQRFRERVRAVKGALGAARPRARWARLLARLGAARAVRFVRLDATWLSVALADFRRHCGAAADQRIFVEDDPAGRVSAYNEGHRMAYLYLERLLGLDPEAVAREAARLDEEERLELEQRIDGEVRRRLREAA